MIGKVEKYLLDKIQEDGVIHITLLDPEKASPQSASKTAREVESCKTAAIMVGGSTLTSTSNLDDVVKAIKKAVKIPVILFPNNITGICRHADAIWFMSLLNSSDPYFIAGAQVLGAPLIKKFGLEAIPLGYIIVGENSAASVVGRACPIPYNKPELAAAHALAAQYFGMRFVYLEAGSGAKQPPPSDMIKAVKDLVNVPLIVGGGIRTSYQVKKAVSAGADIIVTGTVVEEEKRVKDVIGELVECTRLGGRSCNDSV
ncbi:geranylgeranylglyceryl/heptaprenylglyceryl phosphate synthase [Candidatus Bathyarchaeota archaeon]|nr:geranylgeranylglyceryl/heptaprenylglyceryl phosphate synthase [Candidatus Bathyarchaeota archaeon]